MVCKANQRAGKKWSLEDDEEEEEAPAEIIAEEMEIEETVEEVDPLDAFMQVSQNGCLNYLPTCTITFCLCCRIFRLRFARSRNLTFKNPKVSGWW